MHLGRPLTSLIAGAPGEILTVLSRTEQPLTGRTIAALSDGRVSQAGVSRAIGGLVDAGVVVAVPAGRAMLYSLNRDHVAASALTNLASLREVLLERIRVALKTWNPQPIAVAAFGSFGRGEGGPMSDVDLIIIRPDRVVADDASWAEQVQQLSSSVCLWSGNSCDVLEYTRAELKRLVRVKDPLVGSLATGLLDLAGESLGPLLRGRVEK
ncbi:unannotated protein [freshwater metagenome]|uniref:Unannotated protein n=1 Tax=freshwater metagenome TaxID=449393 RepID=A0A6J7FFR3_9ZZZZ